MNIASSGSGSGSVCDLAGGCAGWMGDTGPLILSIVVTLILVGALFYYVKQRVEILETSQKEQIHIMQSFIASIGDQFHRMNVYIQHKLGSTNEVTTNEDSKQPQPQQQQQHNRMGSSRIDISDHDDDHDDTKVIHLRSESESESESDSDSDSSSDGGESNDSDSKSSNTTRDSWLGSKQYKQIKIHDMDTDSAAVDNNEIHDDGIKVVEIDPQFIHCAGSQAGSDSDSSSDSGSDSDSESDSGSQNETKNTIQDIHVIKVDSGSSLEISEKGYGSGSDKEKEKEKEKGAQKKTLVLDLEKEEEVSAHTPSASGGAQYSSLSLKQLRQLVKKKSILVDGENEISKMKREQLIDLLLSSNQQ
jgi:serine-aspartate repeat-containing protein C/D/E